MNYPKTISVLKTMTGTKSLQDQLSNATWDDAQAVLVKLSPDSKAYQTLEQECEDTKPQDVQMDDDEVGEIEDTEEMVPKAEMDRQILVIKQGYDRDLAKLKLRLDEALKES